MPLFRLQTLIGLQGNRWQWEIIAILLPLLINPIYSLLRLSAKKLVLGLLAT